MGTTELFDITSIKKIARKLQKGNAFREFVLGEPDDVPASPLNEHFNLATFAVLPK